MSKNNAMDKWENDHLLLALNYGYCFNQGRHPNTSDADWLMFVDGIKSAYSEVMYQKLVIRLLQRWKMNRKI